MIVEDKIYCYPNTNVLINKFNVMNNDNLSILERKITSVKEQELYENPIDGSFNLKHYLDIHKYLFSDIYPFAGELRKVNKMKKSNIFMYVNKSSDKFKPNDLYEVMIPKLQNLFYNMNSEIKENLSDKDISIYFAKYFIELNSIHPFREGNGRTNREFFREYACHINRELDFNKVDKDNFLNGILENNINVLAHEFEKAMGIVKEK